MKFTPVYVYHSAWLLLLAIACTAAEDAELAQRFADARIVPDVLAVAPAEELRMTYANGIVGHAGNELTPSQAFAEPQLEWNAVADAYYAIIMVTPDAPDPVRPIWREFLRWLVVNVPGMAVDQGQLLCPYLGPTPPHGKGRGRYVFSVFKQPNLLTFDDEPVLNSSSIAGHIHFSTMQFVAKYDLGAPVAGDYFIAQWDDSVDAMLKQLSYVFDD